MFGIACQPASCQNFQSMRGIWERKACKRGKNKEKSAVEGHHSLPAMLPLLLHLLLLICPALPHLHKVLHNHQPPMYWKSNGKHQCPHLLMLVCFSLPRSMVQVFSPIRVMIPCTFLVTATGVVYQAKVSQEKLQEWHCHGHPHLL